MKASIELRNRYIKNRKMALAGFLALFTSMIFACLSVAPAFAAAPQYEWTKSMGGTTGSGGESVAIDGDGNVYLTGYFSKTVDFDPGPGEDNHTSHGIYGDIFLAKFSQHLEDLVVDFGPTYGLYAKYNDTTWTQLTALSPVLLTTGDIDGNGSAEVIVELAGTGIWAKSHNTDLARLHPFGGELIAAADLDGNGQDEVIVDFGPLYGIWAKYNNGSWTKIHSLSPVKLTTGDLDGNGQDEIIVEFPGTGIWARYNNTVKWIRLHGFYSESLTTADLDGSGRDELVIDFGIFGIWAKYNNFAWSKVHNFNAGLIRTGDLDGK